MSATKGGPELPYHYTDAAGLHGILMPGELWAAEAFYLKGSQGVVLCRKSPRA